MNHIYSVVYNVALGQYQVASEKIKQRRVSARKVSAMAIAGALMLSIAGAADIVINERPVTAEQGTSFADYKFDTPYGVLVGLDHAGQPAVNPDTAALLPFDFSGMKEKADTYFPSNGQLSINSGEFDALTKPLNEKIKGYISSDKGYLLISEDLVFETKSLTDFGVKEKGQTEYTTKLGVITTGEGRTVTFKNGLGPNENSKLFKVTGEDFHNQINGNQATLNGFKRSSFILEGQALKGNHSIIIDGYHTDSDILTDQSLRSGAIYAILADVSLKHVLLKNNTAGLLSNNHESHGAAFHISDSIVNLENITFDDNISSSSTNVFGGAVYIDSNSYVNPTSPDLKMLRSSTVLMKDVVFSSNRAIANGRAEGGALYINNDTKLLLNKVTFDNNSVSGNGVLQGGAIYANTDAHGGIKIIDSTFINNKADGSGDNNGGGALFIKQGTLELATTAGNTTLFKGNIVNGKPNSITFDGEVALLISGDGTLDMQDPMGVSTFDGALAVKEDSGEWKLGGANTISSLSVNEGRLSLYKDASIDVLGEDGTNFGSNGKKVEVIATGGNTLSGDSLALHADDVGETKLTFHIADKNILKEATDQNMTAETSVMNWNFDSITATGKTIINVAKQSGKIGDVYHLVHSSKGLNQLNTDSFKLSFYGADVETLADGHRLKGTMILGVEKQNIFVTSSKEILRGDATWTNESKDSIWDVSSENWNVVVKEDGNDKTYSTFAPGDKVIFGDNPGADQTITVDAGNADYLVSGMDVNATKNYTFNGNGISLESGTSIQKENTGNLTFNNIVKGDIALTGGTLIVGEADANKAAEVGSVVAGNGTSVTGHGTVNGVLTLKDGATLSSDKDINHLTVGELVMESGSHFVVNANSDGTNDTVNAKILNTESSDKTSGDITIKDNVTLNIAANGSENTWKPRTVYDIMIAEGKITGNFTAKNIITDLTFLTPETALKAGTDKVMQLTLSRNAVALEDYAYTFNQTAVANNIDKMPSGHAVNDAIIGMRGADVTAAFDNLSGELYASTESALFQNADHLRVGLQQRFTATSRTLWVDALGYSGSIKGDGNAAKVDTTGYGMIMGYDHAISDDVMLGAAIGFEETKVKSKDSGRKGENKVKSTHFALYGLASVADVDFKAVATYSALRFKGDRQIWVPGLEGSTKSSYRGHQIQLFLEGSKTFAMTANYNLTPYANIAYTKIKANGFAESGSKAALTAKGQSNQRTAISIGARNMWNLDSAQQYAITADAALKYTLGDKALEKDLGFVGSDSTFTIRSSSVARTSMVLGLGMKAKHNDMTFDVGYRGEFSNRVKDHSVGVNFKLDL